AKPAPPAAKPAPPAAKVAENVPAKPAPPAAKPVVSRGGGEHRQVTVGAGKVTAHVDFGNIEFGNIEDTDAKTPPGEVAGTMWHDRNGNGRRDPDEPGLEGFTIFVDLDNNTKLDEGEPSTVTDKDGHYSLTLKPG